MFSGKIGLKYSAKNYIPFTKPSKEAKFMLSFPDMNQHMKGNTVKWGKEKLQQKHKFLSQNIPLPRERGKERPIGQGNGLEVTGTVGLPGEGHPVCC